MSGPVRKSVRPSAEVIVPSNAHPPAHLLAVAVRPLSSSTLVCTVSGEVDRWTAPLLRDRLVAQIRLTGPDLVVDLGEVRFFGAAGLGVLVEVLAATDAAGIGFCVVARTRSVLLPLVATGLDVVFTVHPRVDGVPVRGAGSGPHGIPDRVSSRSAVEHGGDVGCDRSGR